MAIFQNVPYLYIGYWEDADLISQHSLCPVLVHASNYCQNVVLHSTEMTAKGKLDKNSDLRMLFTSHGLHKDHQLYHQCQKNSN